MKLAFYQVDAFTDTPFRGNPAAVCPLDKWLDDALMQTIAGEMNLSETVFFVPCEGGFHIRWFTPTCEAALCGHATLAAAHVLFETLNCENKIITFSSLSGPLRVKKTQDGLQLDFPTEAPTPCEIPNNIEDIMGIKPELALSETDLILVYKNQQQIENLEPDFNTLTTLPFRGVIATAEGENCDFVCRFFAPQLGINEDPVTGSAYTKLTPYWSQRLSRNKLSAIQLSKREGHIKCQLSGDRTFISGHSQLVMNGYIHL